MADVCRWRQAEEEMTDDTSDLDTPSTPRARSPTSGASTSAAQDNEPGETKSCASSVSSEDNDVSLAAAASIEGFGGHPSLDNPTASLSINEASPSHEVPQPHIEGSDLPIHRNLDTPEEIIIETLMELPLLCLPDGDTLVYIDPPSNASRLFAERYATPLRVHSQKLLQTGSVFFKEQLNPTKQFRTSRRRKCLPLPPGVKYVVDLTPPQEGDSAVELISDLSCPLGIREWFRTSSRWAAANKLVEGEKWGEWQDVTNRPDVILQEAIRDDNDRRDGQLSQLFTGQSHGNGMPSESAITSLDRNDSSSSQTQPSAVSNDAATDHLMATGWLKGIDPKQRYMRGAGLPLDYTAVRHRCAIERVLHAIEGLDPQIDSAPKMWTVVGVAKYLDCTSTLLDWIVRWIYAPSNTKFIEVLPEVVAKIADDFKNYALARDAFTILVGEHALASAAQRSNEKRKFKLTTFGRRKEDLDETLKSRVEYAGTVFADRVRSTFDALTHAHCAWFAELPEYVKLISLEETLSRLDPEESRCVVASAREYANLLRHYVRGHIVWNLLQPGDDSLPDSYRTLTRPADVYPRDTNEFRVYPLLSSNEKILTRIFWVQLKSRDFGDSQWISLTNEQATVRRLATEYGIKDVSRDALDDAEGRLKRDILNYHALFKRSDAFQSHPARNRVLLTPHGDAAHLFSDTRSSCLRRATLAFDELEAISVGDSDSANTTVASSACDLGSEVKRRRLSRRQDSSDEFFGGNGIVDTGESLERPLPLRTRENGKPDNTRARPDNLPSTVEEQPSSVDDGGVSSRSTSVALSSNTTDDTATLGGISQSPIDLEYLLDGSGSGALETDGRAVDNSALTLPVDSRNVNSPSSASQSRDAISPATSAWNARYISTRIFLEQALPHIIETSSSILANNLSFDANLHSTLLCLSPKEYKYLPLWAGGDDDGSGGVFDPSIPDAEAGPSGPGPRLRTGIDSMTTSDYSFVDADNTVNTSTAVDDGRSSHLDRRKVVVAPSDTSTTDAGDDALWDAVRAATDQRLDKGKGRAVNGLAGEVPAVTDMTMHDSLPVEDDEDDENDEWDGGDEESFETTDIDDETGSMVIV
ncbi:MAG: hypothetical protein M1833_005654 [Piccolia ochrophora]|nr:MAG: hypothetical protein M1833_005654 [Piccolia ochrophora]